MKSKNIKTIAIIGLSDKPTRPGYQVAQYLINQGYNIIPINPNITRVFGQKSYPNISSVPSDISINIIDIFRKSKGVIPVIQEIIKSHRHTLI